VAKLPEDEHVEPAAPAAHDDADNTQVAWTSRFDDAADALLDEILKTKPRPRKMRALAIATFAAFEARRSVEHSQGTPIDRFYKIFLIATMLSPVLVVIAPREAQSVVWDCVGIGSTMLLLYFTYGIYTLRIAGRAAKFILGMVPDPAKWEAVRTRTTSDSKEGGELEAIVAVLLLLVGSIIALYAAYNLWSLYDIAVTKHDRMDYAETYVKYFASVFLLSMLFIVMDLSVAAFNESHAETYVAASSAAHTTIPMCIGIGLVGVYLLAEYGRAVFLHVDQPLTQLSVDFASGALTFQMIISNVLFILIKKNLVFRFFYNSVETTTRP
jgi:hypothetical protein